MECPQAYITLMLLACVKPGLECDCVGAGCDYSPQLLVGSPETEGMPVLSEASCLVLVEKSFLFSKPSPPASLSTSVLMYFKGKRACSWCVWV